MLEDKTVIHIPMLYDCDELSIGKRLVLSYGLFKRQFGVNPSDHSYHTHTGLARSTIAAYRAELDEGDWWNRYRLYTKATNTQTKYGYHYFCCYIHQPGQSLSVASVALWSLLHHFGTNNFTAQFNYAYFAKALGFSEPTSKKCLQALKEAGFIDYEIVGSGRTQRLNLKRYKLAASQLACLRDKGELVDEVIQSDNQELEEFAPVRISSDLHENLQSGTVSNTVTTQEIANYDTQHKEEADPDAFIKYLYGQIGHRGSGRDWQELKRTITECPPRGEWALRSIHYRQLLEGIRSLRQTQAPRNSDILKDLLK